MKTLSERFVSEKRENWKTLRLILLKIRKSSYSALTGDEIKNFGQLYRLACADLAQARTLKLSPDVIDYLNNLVGQAHTFLYSFEPVKPSQVSTFFRDNVLTTLIRHKVFFFISATFFLLPFVVSLLICLANPEKASLLIQSELLEKMSKSYAKGFVDGRGLGMSTAMLSFYIQHNISIAFFSFAAGILAGVGTLYFLVYNGLTLGSITGYIIGIGYGDNFLTFVTAHSVMELMGLIVAGAAGLLLGFTIIKGGRYCKKDQLTMQRSHIFSLLCAAVPMFTLAAAIEGLVSPQPIPYSIKLSIAVLSAGLLLRYLYFVPRARMRKKRSG